MKKQLKETGKYLVTGGVGLAAGIALTWNGGAFLDDIGYVVDQLVDHIVNLEDNVYDLEGGVHHYSGELDNANEQIRQANNDARALHQRVGEAIANIEGIDLSLDSEDLEVE